MAEHDDFSELPEDGSEITGLFPLPNLVMFPHVMQPLQIIEPRYLEMIADCVADDRTLATAYLPSGWESDYEGRPPIDPTVCLGRIVSHHKADDQRQNVLLLGVQRAKVLAELPPTRPFRQARIELIDDEYPAAGAADRPNLQRELVECFRKMIPNVPDVHQQLEPLLKRDVSLGMLTDIVAYSVAIELPRKQQLLAEANVDRRAAILLEHLDAVLVGGDTSTGSSFPPDFSAN